MPIRLELVAIMAAMLLPFVLVNLLLSAGRKALLALLLFGCALALLLLCSDSIVVRTLLSVLGSERSGLPILVATFLAQLGYALLQQRSAQRRRLRLIWVERPSLSVFANYCADRLRRCGWSITASHGDLLVVGQQVEQRIGRATLAIVVEDLPPTRVGRIFRQHKWPLNERRVLVTWFRPSAEFLRSAASDGWAVLHGDEMEQLAERLAAA